MVVQISRFLFIPLTLTFLLPFPPLPSAAASLSLHHRRFASNFSMSSTLLHSPVAKKVKHVMEQFGDVRIDNYYWLRDDSRTNPEVLSYLRQENHYTNSIMSGTKNFEDKLFEEIRGRIKEDDVSAPLRKGHYYYYVKSLEGKEYVQHCRRLIPHNQRVPSVYDIMPIGPEAPHEHVILDENINAQNYQYYRIGAFQVWLHVLGTEQSKDTCLYVEKDDMFSLDLYASESKQYLFVASESKNTRFNFYLDVLKPGEGLKILTPRVDGIDTTVSHRGDHFFITRRSDQFFNSEVVACPVDNTSSTTVLLPHRESVKIQEIQLFSDHLVAYERENGLQKITIYHLPPIGESLRSLEDGQAVNFIDPVYSVYLSESEFASSILRFSYSSLKTPSSVYDYDMKAGISVLKKIDSVLGGFDATRYVTERKWAPALDGTLIPISIVYRKDIVKLDGSDPLLLYGYGSYEVCVDPSFKSSRLSLLDRGFIYAIAHIRGGGEMGRQWYENGKLLKKKNTFTDFIASAEYLIENKFCSKEKLCIEGRSAGGLLIGSVLNTRPDLFKAAVAGVPFVDVVTTMLDPTIPLTTSEWEEWGDPRKEEFYFYMKSYSPVDNVKAQSYPHILVTAGLNDPRVLYSEPAKFVAKLRDMKTDDNILLFKCELGAGHFSKSGRFEKLQEDAFTYIFIFKALNMTSLLES
ncbi:hypothetical protein TanjilG_03728 [Lupinus angustifolius]|uniref:Prolyl endopeptidase n=1 Tax=Lupinus angustifolius TaxID=3871 RepID=A0A1J7HWN8_LUPAN|nr:hypothetical protein TanjilG_03728 [Lupinus angustifolius]